MPQTLVNIKGPDVCSANRLWGNQSCAKSRATAFTKHCESTYKDRRSSRSAWKSGDSVQLLHQPLLNPGTRFPKRVPRKRTFRTQTAPTRLRAPDFPVLHIGTGVALNVAHPLCGGWRENLATAGISSQRVSHRSAHAASKSGTAASYVRKWRTGHSRAEPFSAPKKSRGCAIIVIVSRSNFSGRLIEAVLRPHP